MRNSKTLEFMNNLNEKINKDNIEINKAIANPNLGRNQDRIKQAGYDIQYDGDYIKNPKTGKGIWPKDYSRDEKKKVDFKGKLDSERQNMPKTNRYKWDQEENRIPKSAKIGSKNGDPVFNNDEAEYYSPRYNDESKKSVSTNINTYKKAVKDRDEKTKNAAYYDKEAKRDEDKIKDIEKDKKRHQEYADSARKEANWAEQKRKELMDKVRARKTSTVKEGVESKDLGNNIYDKVVEIVKANFNENYYAIYYHPSWMIQIEQDDDDGFDTSCFDSVKKYCKITENTRGNMLTIQIIDNKRTATVKEGAEPIIKGLKKKLKESVDEDFVNNAYDLIGDYLYNETGRDEVSWGEIKDYIYNDVCDDELHDYNPSKETMEAIKQRLKNGGYKVLEEQEKAAIKKEINKLENKMKETPIKDLTGEEAHKIEKLEKKLKDETLTEARQEEILNKLPKKKVQESLGDKYEVWQKYYEDGRVITEYVQSFDSYEKAQKFVDGLNQDPDCEAWVKDLDESEEVYSEPGQEQQLNEETVGEKITSPSGKFWIGDPCYVLSDDIYYGIWDDKYNFEDGIIDCGNGLSFLVHGTAYGDGSYQGTNGAEYGVDSGTLAVIPMDLVAKLDGVQFGSVEASKTAWLDYNDGTFDITLDNGSFSIITSEEDEEEDGPWDPEEYDDQDNWDDDEYRPGDDE